MDAYPDQIRFVYRDVPFRAFPASEAAMCADEQGYFWAYHDRLFSYSYGLDGDAFIRYAEELNLNMDDFNTCLSEHRYKDVIQKDLDFATLELGINSTPTFFINGIKLIGAQPIEAFMQVIDEELAK
jgi:protein-disulfide isomerase